MTAHDGLYQFKKLSLVLTSACNLACKMCPIIRGPQGTLTREQAFQTAEFAGRRGFNEIEVGGGEPTLISYFWDLLDRLCDTGAEVKVVTNGVRLTEEHVRQLARYPNLSVQVSIDGVGDVHDSIRGMRGAFEASEKTLWALADAGCKISINTVVQRANFRHMVDLYERFKDMPVVFHAFSLVESDKIGSDELIHLQDLDEFMRVMTEVQERGARDGNDVILSDQLLKTYRRRVQYPYFLMHPGKGCTVVRRHLIVTHEAHVIPCFHYAWDKDTIERRLDQRSIDEIVDSPEVREEVRRVIGPRGCRGCSTMCYNWDDDFRRKVMRPTGVLRLRRAYACAKEYIRTHHPGALAAASSIKRFLRPA